VRSLPCFCAESRAQLSVRNQVPQRAGQGCDVARRREHSTGAADYLAGAADTAGHDWQTGTHGFDKGEAKAFGRRVRLTEDVSGAQDRVDVVSLASEAHAIGNAAIASERLEVPEVIEVGRTLRPSDDPARPVPKVAKVRQCL